METDDEDDYFLDPGYAYEDLTFLEACLDNDLDALAAILDDNPTEEEINERDRCGRTGMSHLCSCGLLAALELLVDVPELDVNLPDKDGNTPLILAAQAGHASTVRFLLQDFKGIRIDQANRLGMTALMKAAIQGRMDCSRLLLYAGADPKLKDQGRKLCAQEWALYCGRRECADAIAKFSNTKSFYLKSREAERSAGLQKLERSNSLPDLAKDEVNVSSKPQHKRASLRKKIKKILPGTTTGNELIGGGANKLSVSPGSRSPFAVIARCVSTPVIPGAMNSSTAPSSSSSSSNLAHASMGNGGLMKRPVSTETIPRVEVTHPPKDESGAENCWYPTGHGRSLRSKRRQYSSCDTIITNIITPTTNTYCNSSSGSSNNDSDGVGCSGSSSGGGGSVVNDNNNSSSFNNNNTESSNSNGNIGNPSTTLSSSSSTSSVTTTMMTTTATTIATDSTDVVTSSQPSENKEYVTVT